MKNWKQSTIIGLFVILVFTVVLVACDNDEGDSFKATILEINDNSVTVEPLDGENVLSSSNRITFSKANLADIGASIGDIVIVTYTGGIRETYPAQVDAVNWTIYKKTDT